MFFFGVGGSVICITPDISYTVVITPYLAFSFGSFFDIVGTWCFHRVTASVIDARIADDATSVFSDCFLMEIGIMSCFSTIRDGQRPGR